MADIARETVLRSLLMVLDEAYRGPADPRGTWFASMEPDSGVLGTLAALTAGEASRAPAPGRRSVAAHAAHLRFSMDVGTRWIRGETPQVDWSESWAGDAVDDAAWSGLRSAIADEYAALRRAVKERDDWSDPLRLAGAVGAIAHAAYHLGAMRQIVLEAGARPASQTADTAGAG